MGADLFHISGFATVPTAIDTAVTTGAFLIVDVNGTAGYQANQDLVI
jgi:hypothetical protein